MARLSVIITHYDSPNEIPYALNSVLYQSYSDFHVCLVDDCSPDDLWFDRCSPFLESGRLSIYRSSENVGTYRLKNKFIQNIDSEYLAFQDSDDISLPNRFELQMDHMHGSKIGILGSSFYQLLSNSANLELVSMPKNVNRLLWAGKRFVTLHPTWVIRRSILDVLGGFDFSTRFGGDDEFLIRSSYCTKIQNLKSALYIKRERPQSLTQSVATGFASKIRLDYKCLVEQKVRMYSEMDSKRRLNCLRILKDEYEFSIDEVYR